jgi:hypothetical protein
MLRIKKVLETWIEDIDQKYNVDEKRESSQYKIHDKYL